MSCCPINTTAVKPSYHLAITVNDALSQMTNPIVITVLCITRLGGHSNSQEESAISCYSVIKLCCWSSQAASHLYSSQSGNDLALNIPHAHTNVGKISFRYYAPYKWSEVQTAFTFILRILKLYYLMSSTILVNVFVNPLLIV